MKKLIVAGVLVLLALTAVGAQQSQTAPPRDMGQMMQMMQNCMMNLRDADISVSDTPDGIAVTFKPKDPAQLEALRTRVRAHVERMQTGECPMMRGMPEK